MIEILIYAFGVMYSPGPSNLLSLSGGLNNQLGSTLRFCLGVGCAMLILFLAFGYTGSWLVNPGYQLLISCIGSLYIAYLAYKIALTGFNLSEAASNPPYTSVNQLGFKAGLVMQLLNPKSFVAIFPIVSIQFPAAQIAGSAIFFWAVLLSILALGAPSVYLLMGVCLGKKIRQPHYFRLLNISMALLLLYVAGDIAYNHAFLKWA